MAGPDAEIYRSTVIYILRLTGDGVSPGRRVAATHGAARAYGSCGHAADDDEMTRVMGPQK